MEEFAKRLKELRKEKNITLTQLAKDTGIDKNLIDDWENVRSIPNPRAVLLLSRYFGVTTDYLLGFSE